MRPFSLLLIFSLLIASIGVASGASPTTLSFQPSEGEVKRGDMYKVEIVVSAVSDLDTALFTLHFDSSVLEFVSAKAGGLMPSAELSFNVISPGRVRILITQPIGASGISGSGPIAIITFRAIGSPGSSSSLRLVDASMADSNANPIPVSTIDGKVTIKEAPSPSVMVSPASMLLRVGEVKALDIVLSEARNGLAGYEMEVRLVPISVKDLPEELRSKIPPIAPGEDVADIVDVKFPGWAQLNDKAIYDDVAKIKAVDMKDEIRPGSANVSLATITIKAKAQGFLRIDVNITRMDDDEGMEIAPIVKCGFLVVISGPPPIDGIVPKDLDNDGLFEDVNGNGKLDFDDVVKFFKNFDHPSVAGHFNFYDFNRNGKLDFDDVVKLFKMV